MMLEGLTPPELKIWSCKVKVTAESLPEKDKQILLDAIGSPAWGSRPLSIALRERGIEISDSTISRHRKQHCTCFRR